MYKIVDHRRLNSVICRLEVLAPAVAAKAKPGHFVMLRIHERGERIPLTIYAVDREKGTVTLVVQEIGKTTAELCSLSAGEYLLDFVGPLGKPTHVEKFGRVACVGGGVGVAEIAPIARALKAAGNEIVAVIGFRTKELVILEEEMKSISDRLYVTTDDGTYGRKGFVTDVLKELIAGERFDLVMAVGPLPMMKAVADATRKDKIKTMVSLNSIMVDGTGMCGSCRVEVGGETKFVCVDGPELDGHLVDFDNLSRRQVRYLKEEKNSHQRYKEECKTGKCRG